MNQTRTRAKETTENIIRWLNSQAETIKVENVENDRYYQDKNINLIWQNKKSLTKKNIILISIKSDIYDQSDNLFFETDSNQEKQKSGCFIYTEANLLFYYFTASRILYSVPMPKTRDWFNSKINYFSKYCTQTKVGTSSYTNVGRLVPIQTLMREVKEVTKQQI